MRRPFPIARWAPAGSANAAAYDRAFNERVHVVFDNEFAAKHGARRVWRTRVDPLPDGSLFARGIVHKGGDKGVVTASVGLATFTSADKSMTSIELIRRADEALYNAKGAGRDRVTGWRPRHEVRPVRGARA